MARMVEIRYRSKMAELGKLEARLVRLEATYEKKYANAVRYGVNEMDCDAHNAWLATVPTNEYGYILDKKAIKRNEAWWDLQRVISDIEETKRGLGIAEDAFNKAQEALDKHNKEVEALADAKSREALWEAEFKIEQAEWAKDGITLEERYTGTTPKGKRFWIERNNGWTERSWHCFTLYIDGDVIFTSGEFWRAYMIIKAN